MAARDSGVPGRFLFCDRSMIGESLGVAAGNWVMTIPIDPTPIGSNAARVFVARAWFCTTLR
jgi:hypothetical protein